MKYLYFVYILRCNDSTFYIGLTNNLERRVSEHQLGISDKAYTKTRLPVTLVYSAEFNDIRHAIAFEKQIKGWSRAKKQALIDGDWDRISKLSRSKTSSTLRQAQGDKYDLIINK